MWNNTVTLSHTFFHCQIYKSWLTIAPNTSSFPLVPRSINSCPCSTTTHYQRMPINNDSQNSLGQSQSQIYLIPVTHATTTCFTSLGQIIKQKTELSFTINCGFKACCPFLPWFKLLNTSSELDAPFSLPHNEFPSPNLVLLGLFTVPFTFIGIAKQAICRHVT